MQNPNVAPKSHHFVAVMMIWCFALLLVYMHSLAEVTREREHTDRHREKERDQRADRQIYMYIYIYIERDREIDR
jgi:hypothetical protein